MTVQQPPRHGGRGDPHPEQLPTLPLYESSQLLGEGKEVVIRHAGELYRLRLTRQNKLILTK